MCPPLCGGGTSPCAHKPPQGVPIPPWPKQDRRDSGVTPAVWGKTPDRVPTNLHGASLSFRGPGRTGGTQVCPPLCGGGTTLCAHKPPRGVPIPLRPRQDQRDSGVTAAVLGKTPHRVPTEADSDPRGHLWVTWGVYLCAGKPPLADIILSHPPDLT